MTEATPTPTEPWSDRGHLRDGIVYCLDPDCEACGAAIDMREDHFPVNVLTIPHPRRSRRDGQ